jgi:catechol 2,3-dioxygenase-like lactoylglutathione lyase family enzyme
MTTQVLDRVDNDARGITGFNHVAMPVRDPYEACRFWSTIFGGENMGVHDNGTFGMVVMPGKFLFGFALQREGQTGRKAEYPHYGLDVDPERMDALRDRLIEFGVPCDLIWTRFRSEALMYFRDPSGNMFELYCHQGYKDVANIALSRSSGGNFVNDFEALNYDTWRDPGPEVDAMVTKPSWMGEAAS